MYYLGNDASADVILFWARLPILLLAVAFGIALYVICRRRYGEATALLALFLYALSPNYIAHATLVTTDLGASVFIFLAIAAFGRFMDLPGKANVLVLSLGLAGAELAKFSGFILYPLLGFMCLVVVIVSPRPRSIWERFKNYFGGYVGAAALSIVWVWVFYFPQVRNMPNNVQYNLISGALADAGQTSFDSVLHTLNGVVILKPLVQYLLGLALVYGRVSNGNVTYFNGQVSATGFQLYFPELFAAKTQVAFLILLLVAALAILWRAPSHRHPLKRVARHIRTHVLEWTLGVFAAFYFTISAIGKLDLGIRHILPIYIPLFVLVAITTIKIWRSAIARGKGFLATVFFGGLLAWYGASTVLVYPNFLSYFNEIFGGANNADKYFADSSVDWGQDLKRFKSYVDDHPQIKHIALDYFGGGEPAYYFCGRRYDLSGALVTNQNGFDCSHSVYEPWHAQNGQYTGQYIAVSETFLEYDRYYSRYNAPSDSYDYLRSRTPIAKIGGSIYVYKLY